MTRKLPAIILPLLFLVFVSRASAVVATTENIQLTATPVQPTIAVKATATDSATKLREQLKLLQEQKKDAITQVRTEAKTLIDTKKEEFRTRLQTIKDQKKKTLVERIDSKIAELNQKQTTKFTETLTRLQSFLDKMSSSATIATVATDVQAAQAAITAAKTANEAQAAKTYTMTISDDATLKLNAGTTVSQFRLDLVAVHKLLIDAKQAVQKLNTDKGLIKKEATNSAKL